MTTGNDLAAEIVDDLGQLLKVRESTHGDFQTLASVHSDLIHVIEAGRKGRRFNDDVALSIWMIMLKMARITCGDAEFKDHWDDIAGYARLISDRLKREGQ